MKSSWQVATAAEAFAAAQFARCGWDVSVQYGANQPEYDLVAVDGDRMLKVSVKGSKDGGWGLTQSHISNADYRGAADARLRKHSKRQSSVSCSFAVSRQRSCRACTWPSRSKSLNGSKPQQLGAATLFRTSVTSGPSEPKPRELPMSSPPNGASPSSALRRSQVRPNTLVNRTHHGMPPPGLISFWPSVVTPRRAGYRER